MAKTTVARARLGHSRLNSLVGSFALGDVAALVAVAERVLSSDDKNGMDADQVTLLTEAKERIKTRLTASLPNAYPPPSDAKVASGEAGSRSAMMF